jgi:hypothetical protein
VLAHAVCALESVGGGIGYSRVTREELKMETFRKGDVDTVRRAGARVHIMVAGVLVGAALFCLESLQSSATADEWVRINPSGFGDPSTNQEILAMATFDGFLYAGTSGQNPTSEIWKTLVGGNVWRQVTPGWRGTPRRIKAMAVFGDYLYVGTVESTHAPAELWRTRGEFRVGEYVPLAPGRLKTLLTPLKLPFSFPSNLKVPIELWSYVTPAREDWQAGEVTSMVVFQGDLYASTSSPLQIWRTPNGRDWEPVV